MSDNSRERSTVGEFWGWFNSIDIRDAIVVQEMVVARVGEQLASGRDITLGSLVAQVKADAEQAIEDRKREQAALDPFGDDDDYGYN